MKWLGKELMMQRAGMAPKENSGKTVLNFSMIPQLRKHLCPTAITLTNIYTKVKGILNIGKVFFTTTYIHISDK